MQRLFKCYVKICPLIKAERVGTQSMVLSIGKEPCGQEEVARQNRCTWASLTQGSIHNRGTDFSTLHSVKTECGGTYLLTPCCRVLLEKLTGLQLVKKFPAFHRTWRFITALTSVRHLSLSWASPIQSIYPHPTSWRSILILSTHLYLGLSSGLLPSSFPTKTLYTPLSSTICATCPAPLILLDFITRTILGEEYKLFSSSLCILLHSPHYVVPPRSKYSPQHHVLKHPQLPFLPQCHWPSFTPIQNNRQNYISLYTARLFLEWKHGGCLPNHTAAWA